MRRGHVRAVSVGWPATQVSNARNAFRELLRENQFISFNTSVERGGKMVTEQAAAVIKVCRSFRPWSA